MGACVPLTKRAAPAAKGGTSGSEGQPSPTWPRGAKHTQCRLRPRGSCLSLGSQKQSLQTDPSADSLWEGVPGSPWGGERPGRDPRSGRSRRATPCHLASRTGPRGPRPERPLSARKGRCRRSPSGVPQTRRKDLKEGLFFSPPGPEMAVSTRPGALSLRWPHCSQPHLMATSPE